MTKARDLANIISGGFTASDIPNLDASKITSGSIADARIPNLSASKITSGTFADARIANLSASKLTGSIANARIPASAVSQHATTFDDNAIVNDLSTIALRQATNENAIAYNTNSSFVDVFQDSSGIASHTTSARNASEYISSVINANTDTTLEVNASNFKTYFDWNNISNNSWLKTSSSMTDVYNPTATTNAYFNAGATDISSDNAISDSEMPTLVEAQWADNSSATRYTLQNDDTSGAGGNRIIHSNFGLKSGTTFKPTSTFIRWRNGASGHGDTQLHGSTIAGGYEGTFLSTMKSGTLTNGSTWSSTFSNSNFYDSITVRTYGTAENSIMYDFLKFNGTMRVSSLATNATGNFISNVITAPTSTSSMGAIITYQDNAGTNSLNTDIILQLSADNGSNFTTATLTALPNFATGIKMAKVNDLAVTAGTQLKYKISFANQSSGSKEARIRGVSLQY